MILSIGTDRPKQTVQTQIRLLLKSSLIGSTLFAIPSAPFGLITGWLNKFAQILGELEQVFKVSNFLGFLR